MGLYRIASIIAIQSQLIEFFYNSVCHFPAVFHRVRFEGVPLVKGKKVTVFTNGEEEAVHLTKVVPFLLKMS
jgi:hypothetical protein